MDLEIKQKKTKTKYIEDFNRCAHRSADLVKNPKQKETGSIWNGKPQAKKKKVETRKISTQAERNFLLFLFFRFVSIFSCTANKRRRPRCWRESQPIKRVNWIGGARWLVKRHWLDFCWKWISSKILVFPHWNSNHARTHMVLKEDSLFESP